MFSTAESATRFSEEFRLLDGVASTNRKTLIIGEPEEAV